MAELIAYQPDQEQEPVEKPKLTGREALLADIEERNRIVDLENARLNTDHVLAREIDEHAEAA